MLIVAAIVLAVIALAVVKIRSNSSAGTGTNSDSKADGTVTTPSADDKVTLAQCLTDHGAKFFGASWCPHCAQQKKDFGAAAMKKVNYIECAVPGDNSQQTQICKDNNIKGYPTWHFADGTEKTGEQTLEDLAKAAGCAYGDVKAPGSMMLINGATPDANAPAGVPNNK
jgi:thiol-disulfide isomerase/thioredoxin